MKVAVLGCGRIGVRRAVRLPDEHKVVVVGDAIEERARSLASSCPGAFHTKDWKEAANNSEADIAIVATTHESLAQVTLVCLESGKHVLVEKPAARRAAELEPVLAAAKRLGRKVRVGFNHRYHPAVRKAKHLADEGAVGELMFVRGRYGHGGRPGYEKEWRADPVAGGGGELLDQGIHLIDLSRWFLGEFSKINGQVQTYFWDMPVEDNAFLCLTNEKQQTAWLHASWTEWKNMFSLEIYGRGGKLQVDGLGGSYGVEQLTYHKMPPQMGPPETTVWQFPEEDSSWDKEFQEFVEDIELDREPSVNLMDAIQALKIVESIYDKEKSK